MYVIGMGTGRCGSQSLAKFLNAQKHTTFTHEKAMDLTIWPMFFPFDRAMQTMRSYGGKWKGDVSPAWCVWAAHVIQKYPRDTRVIWLHRDPSEVARSFMEQKLKKFPHWLEKGRKFSYGFMGMYPCMEKEFNYESVYRCVDRFYWLAASIVKVFPDHCYIWDMNELNRVDVQSEVLEWLGMRERDWVLGMTHEDKGDYDS
jgi:hypothetical protein